MKQLWCIVFLFWQYNASFGQLEAFKITDSSEVMEELVLTSYRPESINKSSLNISVVDLGKSKKYGSTTLTEALTKSPGISALSTGVGISKPVIRGSSGNRVLTLLNGLKFDNQQWQEEHGLGLSDLGVGKIEIIKGPMSVLYGSEALAGVINIIDEPKLYSKSLQWDGLLRVHSNTRGFHLQINRRQNFGNKWTRLNIGYDNHCDYSDGRGLRILNSRFDGFALKWSVGKEQKFKGKNWISENTFATSANRFGFIFNDVYTFISPDSRWSRSFLENPCHLVFVNSYSSQNNIQLSNQTNLNFNYGIQSNERLENEGGGQISINMHLLTLQYLAKIDRKISDKQRLIFSNMLVLENNYNFGGRKLVPNANLAETNFSVYHEYKYSQFLNFENGLGLGYKFIQTFYTPTVNSEEKEIFPFKKHSPYINAFSGLSVTHGFFHFKMNVSSGIRVPNLAELSSNGLHEGIYVYEVGNPLFKNEDLIAGNLQFEFEFDHFKLNLSPFYNQYFNYIYLSPSNQKWMALYPKWFYQQQNATQFGFEIGFQSNLSKHFDISGNYSQMQSKTADGIYTPYTPANKLNVVLNYNVIVRKKYKLQSFIDLDFVNQQKQVFSHFVGQTGYTEIGSRSYKLLNVGIAISLKKVEFSLTGKNLLNEVYFDNLSRFKNYNLNNIGRNIVLTYKWLF